MTDTTAVRRTWGERIRTARTEQGLTQQALAEVVGIRQATLSNIENGQGGSVTTLVRIANALGLAHADLFGESAA